MVIAQSKEKGITAFVILKDDEKLPQNLNSPAVVVCRYGDSTNRELQIIKPLGKQADPSILADPAKPICNLDTSPSNVRNLSPLHQHEDGTWWFYEETWALENGPFDTESDAYEVLKAYCLELQAVKERTAADATEPSVVESDSSNNSN
jgi:hypothetical protein